ncbi:uncharacterized protein [Lolium perenne]|nr:uncharacterized protein LOC127323513 isoform X2 [Lolium perenne]
MQRSCQLVVLDGSMLVERNLLVLADVEHIAKWLFRETNQRRICLFWPFQLEASSSKNELSCEIWVATYIPPSRQWLSSTGCFVYILFH